MRYVALSIVLSVCASLACIVLAVVACINRHELMTGRAQCDSQDYSLVNAASDLISMCQANITSEDCKSSRRYNLTANGAHRFSPN
jgi:hypothetical protein